MLCLFALSMVLSAWALPPDEKKVTLDLKDVPMETFLTVSYTHLTLPTT